MLRTLAKRTGWLTWPWLHWHEAEEFRKKHMSLGPFRFRLDFTFRDHERCTHRNRFGIRCFRMWTHDRWCGLHNYLCRPAPSGHWRDGNRHPWRRS